MHESALSVLLLHGWQNRRPAGHWQHLLADELRDRGIDVRYPQLPDPDDPDRAVWSALVAAEIGALTGRQRVVVAHSLATWVVLELVARGNLAAVDRVLLVAPVSRAVLAANAPISEFDPGIDDDTLAAAIAAHGGVQVVCSDDDPYFTGGAAGWADRIGATVHPMSGQGHLALGDGYGSWPSVRDWVLAGGVDGRIEPR